MGGSNAFFEQNTLVKQHILHIVWQNILDLSSTHLGFMAMMAGFSWGCRKWQSWFKNTFMHRLQCKSWCAKLSWGAAELGFPGWVEWVRWLILGESGWCGVGAFFCSWENWQSAATLILETGCSGATSWMRKPEWIEETLLLWLQWEGTLICTPVFGGSFYLHSRVWFKISSEREL